MSENKKISQEIKDVTPTSAGSENTVQKADKRKFKFDRKWFSRWYYNNNLLAVAALLISVICWVVLTLNVTADTSKTFTDIPIKIDTQALEENLGLHMISVLDPSTYTDRKADVTVSGSI
ncbi:MAG: hypothetical protein IJC18_00660, partial [Clostridia bacterium]|nr:hypothetical protein [Clostridia bacterium]